MGTRAIGSRDANGFGTGYPFGRGGIPRRRRDIRREGRQEQGELPLMLPLEVLNRLAAIRGRVTTQDAPEGHIKALRET